MRKKQIKPKRPGYFIMKHEEWLKSPAYRDLTTLARCLLDEFQRIYLPNRNGRLSVSVENAAKLLNVCPNTARKAYRELEEHGFLALCHDACYTAGKATEYRLTIEQHNGKEPTDDWRLWEPGKAILHLSRKLPKKQNDTAKTEVDQRENSRGHKQNLRIVVSNDSK